VTVVETLNEAVLSGLSTPDIAFIVASPRIGDEIKSLLAVNPDMDIVIYTLDFEVLSSLSYILRENGLVRTEALHIEVSRVNNKGFIEPYPDPWLISCKSAKAAK
jgi:precorrin-6Y C5,15-methyltransferase (decarboxylating)